MPKAQIKSLLLSLDHSSTSATYSTALPTVTMALSAYKQSLDKLQQAKSRYKVLHRQLSKQKSTTTNIKKYNQYSGSIQEKAQFDRLLKKWDQTNKSIQLDRQSLKNKRSRNRIQDNIHHSKYSCIESNMERYHNCKLQSEENQQYINEYNKQVIKQRINNRVSLQREQRERQEYISYFNEQKQQRIRHRKSSQIRKLFNKSFNNHKIVNSIVEYNYDLKDKKRKQTQTSKQLKNNSIPVNLACTIKNTQT